MAQDRSKVFPLIKLVFVSVLCVNSVISFALPSSSETGSGPYCPIHKDLNDFDSVSHNDSMTRIIDLSKIESRKVTINFYTPNPMKPLERHLEETTVAFPYYLDDTTGSIVPVVPVVHPVPAKGQPSPSSKSTTSSSHSQTEYDTTTSSSGTEYYTEAVTETDSPATTTFSSVFVTPQRSSVEQDVMCQWEFKTSNESEYLLLTFNNLSAPYSEDCSEAYVSMQKDDGYESRWCGTRRQANARPMALFSKRNAKVTVFRKGSSTISPPTGFSVTVESIGVRNSLRVLINGK